MSSDPIACSRCGSAGAGLDHPPWPGELGRRVARGVCPACWGAWLEEQTKLINEYRLNVRQSEHRERLRAEMERFLGLSPAGGPARSGGCGPEPA